MRRREVIAVLASTGIAWPLDVRSQGTAGVFRIGMVSPINMRSAPQFSAFEQRLREIGIFRGAKLSRSSSCIWMAALSAIQKRPRSCSVVMST